MMATFAVIVTRRWVIRRWTWLSPRRLRVRRIILAALALAAAGLLILTMALTSHPGQKMRTPGRSCSVASQQAGDC